MKNRIKVLLIDDHPLIIEGYESILLYQDNGNELKVEKACDCKTAFDKISIAAQSNPFDVIFLDMNLPAYAEENIFSGEDLGIRIRAISPSSKIIVLTMEQGNFRLYNIVKNVNPEGLLIKNDVDSEELNRVFREVLQERVCYSHSVTNLIRQQFTNDIVLDKIDRAILYFLSKGIRTKELPERVYLSLAAVEKRKRNLKDVFGLERDGDLALIEKAKEMGFL